MLILGIESSCDETGAAITKSSSKSNKLNLLSNVVASSLSLHAKSGGIVPENAAREQSRFIIPVIKEAIEKARVKPTDLDAIAITYGPGLIGSLIIGVETAKTLSLVYGKPLIPTNHLLGHIYANFIENDRSISFPALGLIVSGGHTDLILIKKHGEIKWLGGTRDDAAGEALDKIGRILGLPYPGGPYIEKVAKNGKIDKNKFPRPMIGSKDLDFSFSGLKASVMREVLSIGKLDEQTISNISASVQYSVINVLISKTLKAAKKYGVKSILLGGGVAVNQSLRDQLELEVSKLEPKIELYYPPKYLCTDNAAMIAAAAFFNGEKTTWQKVDANPSLYFD